jgi:O-antigen ligase
MVNVVDPVFYFVGFLQTALIAVLYFLIVSIVRYKRKVLLWIIYATILGSVWSALGGAYEVVTGDLILKGKASSNLAQFGVSSAAKGTGRKEFVGGGRIGGFSGNPGGHGYKYAVWTCLALCLPLIAGNWKGKALGIGYIALAIVNIFGSGSKTSIVGLLCGLAVFFWLGNFRKKWLYVVPLVVGIIIFISLLPPVMRAKILHKSNVSKGSLEMRYPQYRVAYHMILDHPIVGVGTGNYNANSLRYAKMVPGHSRTGTAFLHNGYLQIWSETGTLGFLLFLSLFLSGGASLIKAIRSPPDRQIREISVSLLAAWVCWLVALLLYPTVLDEIGWVVIAMSTCIIFIIQKEQSEKMDSPAVPA